MNRVKRLSAINGALINSVLLNGAWLIDVIGRGPMRRFPSVWQIAWAGSDAGDVAGWFIEATRWLRGEGAGAERGGCRSEGRDTV